MDYRVETSSITLIQERSKMVTNLSKSGKEILAQMDPQKMQIMHNA